VPGVSNSLTRAEALASCFANMRAAGLELTIEAAAFQPHYQAGTCGGGAECFAGLKTVLDLLQPLNPPQIRIVMQEPLTEAAKGNVPPTQALTETVAFISLLRSQYSVNLSYVEAYPAISASTISWFVTALVAACQSANLTPPDQLWVDHDKDAQGWSWADISWLENVAHAWGWQYAYIFGSPTWGSDGWRATALYTGWALSLANIVPDIYTFESWEWGTGDPADAVPEWASSSFTGTVRVFFEAGVYAGSWTDVQTRIIADQYLYPNDAVYSISGEYFLVYQGDGNLVLYRYDWTPLWASNTWWASAGFAVMQSDGNFVVYDASNVAVWWSGTDGSYGAWAELANDGHFRIRDAYGTIIYTIY
jgi:hypothetical protein